jgi:hypothetical protein
MKLYIKSSRGYQQTDGMDQDTVTRLLIELGATDITFIDEITYTAAIAALQPKI